MGLSLQCQTPCGHPHQEKVETSPFIIEPLSGNSPKASRWHNQSRRSLWRQQIETRYISDAEPPVAEPTINPSNPSATLEGHHLAPRRRFTQQPTAATISKNVLAGSGTAPNELPLPEPGGVLTVIIEGQLMEPYALNCNA